jgi:hypothetical protein
VSGHQVLIAVDQLVNALLGGMADETLSARAWRCEQVEGSRAWGAARRGVDVLFFWQPGHCRAAWLAEIERRQLPGPYRL